MHFPDIPTAAVRSQVWPLAFSHYIHKPFLLISNNIPFPGSYCNEMF